MNLVPLSSRARGNILNSIPFPIAERINNQIWLVGGAIRDLMMGKTPRDWDLLRIGPKGHPATSTVGSYTVQYINHQKFDNSVALSSFDFTVNMAAIYRNIYGDIAVMCDQNFEEDIAQRRLRIRHFDPKTFFHRLARMCSYGFMLPTSELAKVVATLVAGTELCTEAGMDIRELCAALQNTYNWTDKSILVSEGDVPRVREAVDLNAETVAQPSVQNSEISEGTVANQSLFVVDAPAATPINDIAF